MEGCHRRMGDVWLPNQVVSCHIMRQCFVVLEENWSSFFEFGDEYSLLRIAQSACVLIAGYFAGLRGEEIGKANLTGLLEDWDTAVRHPKHPHVPFMLAGRFKGTKKEVRFYQPLCCVTEDGFEIAKWFHRYLGCLLKKEITRGPLFPGKHPGLGMLISELNTGFFMVLREVQRKYPSLISDNLDVTMAFSVERSLRRGAT